MEKNEHPKSPGSAADLAETDRLKQDLQREHDLYLRALADYENYRKRVDRDRAMAARSGKRELLLPLLDVLDDFDRALKHLGNAPSSVAEGIESLHRKFLNVLQAQGVTPMASIGETFNPEFHDAIGLTDSENVGSGSVAEELQRGYRWGDEVLRPARVRVAR
jgi:molecular chaperone GrpE